MTGKDVYERALQSLGYTDDQALKNKAVTVVNQVYDRLHSATGASTEWKPINGLSDEINLPDRVCAVTMVYGVAERLALGEGDGELQQYFAAQFDHALARINTVDSVQDVMPKGW